MQCHGVQKPDCFQNTLHCPSWMKNNVWGDTVGAEFTWRQKAEAFKTKLSNLDFQALARD